jgi:glycine dehydrogenase subunit 1
LESPGRLGADIVTGEAQSFGIPLSFGGPYLGFMACRKEYVRQFPGRIVGQTKDVDGKRGFVLTLSTREQHIRRERATSNICTNQAWCALRATIFLESLGREGIKELAWQNAQKAHYAREQLTKIPGLRPMFAAEFFNEFVVRFENSCKGLQNALEAKNIFPGLFLEDYYPELEGCLMINVTEIHTQQDINRLVQELKNHIRQDRDRK